MKYIKKFNDEAQLNSYKKSNFVSPHIYLDSNLNTVKFMQEYKQLEYISSTQTGGQYINLGCKLFENTDDIIIDIKFNLKGGGKDYNLTSSVNQTKPSILIGSISEAKPYYGFVVRKSDIGQGADNLNYVTMYTKWQISNSVYKNANGDQSGKQKYYPTYLAGNISGYEQTYTGIVYEKTLIIDKLSTIESSTFNQMSHLDTYMFAIYNDGTTGNHMWYEQKMWRFSESDVYYCKIMKGDTVIRDLIPVLRTYDNTPGLFDLEYEKFYPSQGDNPFVAGPQI